MVKVKKFFLFLITLLIIGIGVYKYKDITKYLNELVINVQKNEVQALNSNEYMKKDEFMYIKNVDDFEPDNYNDIVNIIYTALNSGDDSFYFYCSNEYSECLNDVEKISGDQILLSSLNNFVSPFNSFKHVKISYDTLGKITLEFEHNYTSSEIEKINTQVDEIINNNLNEEMTDRDKIKVIHDYIINNTKYDVESANLDNITNGADKINGVLDNHLAICSGYSDLMAVILDRLGILNYKITYANHVWNGVYIDNTWLHLDVTWDDPVSESGKEYLLTDFFLIDTDQLLKIDKDNSHKFDTDIYLEYK